MLKKFSIILIFLLSGCIQISQPGNDVLSFNDFMSEDSVNNGIVTSKIPVPGHENVEEIIVNSSDDTQNDYMEGESMKKEFKLSSVEFEDGGNIPSKFTCEGENISPKLIIEGIPKNAKSLALIMDDPDAVPVAGFVWVHWIMWNIPLVSEIIEGSVPEGAVQGLNSSKMNKYYGPCPPDKEHKYFFKLYALDTKLDLPDSTDKKGLEAAMKGHILAKTQLTGTYKLKN